LTLAGPYIARHRTEHRRRGRSRQLASGVRHLAGQDRVGGLGVGLGRRLGVAGRRLGDVRQRRARGLARAHASSSA
jgi:hypothetical protein